MVKLPGMAGEVTHACRARNIPLGLGYLQAFARQDATIRARADMEITTEDELGLADAEIVPSPVTLAERLIEKKALIYAFSAYVWNVGQVLEVAGHIKNRRPEAIVIIGGPEIEREWTSFPAGGPIDVVAFGEGEETFVELCRHFLTGAPALDHIRGIGFKQAGGIHWTEPRSRLVDLDVLPSPYVEGILRPRTVTDHVTEQMWIETSRGCPFSCSFCDWGGKARRPSNFSLQRVRAELDWAALNGVRRAYIIDPELNLHRPRFRQLCDVLSEFHAAHGMGFYGFLLGHLIEPRTKADLLRAGITLVEIGLQSASPEALRLARRTMPLGQTLSGIRSLLPEIQVIIDLIIGLPGETASSFLRTLLALRTDPLIKHATIRIHLLSVLPNTPLRREARALGLIYRDTPPYTVLRTPQLSEKDIEGIMRAQGSFSLEPIPHRDMITVLASTASGTEHRPKGR